MCSYNSIIMVRYTQHKEINQMLKSLRCKVIKVLLFVFIVLPFKRL